MATWQGRQTRNQTSYSHWNLWSRGTYSQLAAKSAHTNLLTNVCLALLRSFRRQTFFQKDVWLFCGQCAGKHMSQKFLFFYSKLIDKPFVWRTVLLACCQFAIRVGSKVLLARLRLISMQTICHKTGCWFFCGKFAGRYHVTNEAAFFAHQAATTPAMAPTGSQKNKRTKAPSSKKVGHNTLINRLIFLKGSWMRCCSSAGKTFLKRCQDMLRPNLQAICRRESCFKAVFGSSAVKLRAIMFYQ